MGQAYGFFNCRASKDEIKARLPKMRDLAKTPSDLEISLTENNGNIEGDQELQEIARGTSVVGQGNRYVLRADYPEGTNEETAKKVVTLLNKAYESPLYEEKEPFWGQIVNRQIAYRDTNGEYAFMD